MTEPHYQNNQLMIEDVSLSQLAKEVGTPCYVYSRSELERNYLAYREALDAFDSGRHKVCFAVKANSNIGVLSVLAKLGSGFDIVSIGELERVLLAGGNPSQIVFSGVAKLRNEIERALDVGIHCFNIESETELQRIASIAQEKNCIAPISIRVNPDVDAETHPYISTGLKENKFGINIDQALGIYLHAQQYSSLRIIGIDCHIGSQLTTTAPFIHALERVLALVDKLDANGITLEHIDVGGGLGVTYQQEQPPAPGDYVKQLMQVLGDRPQTLLMEPGRSIAANAGVLLTRVDTIKKSDDRHFAIVDAAMNDMIRPALYSAWMDIVPLRANSSAQSYEYDIVGPVCETGDFLGKQRTLAIAEGDLLSVNSAGAYGFVMSSNYNSRVRAAEVMVHGASYQIIRQRETLEDLVKGESIVS
ncbi:MAG: diaminopimelate decarboxylase [Pseudomonadales bacterium]|nr:diaminopimelate decarboxylase [Pseudomonadales bacterium]